MVIQGHTLEQMVTVFDGDTHNMTSVDVSVEKGPVTVLHRNKNGEVEL